MGKVRVVAVEDDVLHEEKLRMHLEKLGYELMAVLCDAQDVMPAVRTIAPDVILMDIDLSQEVSGIDLATTLNQVFDIPIVYVTAFVDNRTFQEAKKTAPAAYVTKPYKMIELQSAIELAIANRKKMTVDLVSTPKKVPEHFFIKENDQLTQITLASILLIEASDKYCTIYTNEKKYLLRTRLKDLVAQLPPYQFCQTHRSFVVSLPSVAAVDMNTCQVRIANKKIPVSKSYKENFFSRLQALG